MGGIAGRRGRCSLNPERVLEQPPDPMGGFTGHCPTEGPESAFWFHFHQTLIRREMNRDRQGNEPRRHGAGLLGSLRGHRAGVRGHRAGLRGHRSPPSGRCSARVRPAGGGAGPPRGAGGAARAGLIPAGAPGNSLGNPPAGLQSLCFPKGLSSSSLIFFSLWSQSCRVSIANFPILHPF